MNHAIDAWEPDMVKRKTPYLSNSALDEMSQREVDDYTQQLSEHGLDDGPQWDRIYRWLEENGHL